MSWVGERGISISSGSLSVSLWVKEGEDDDGREVDESDEEEGDEVIRKTSQTSRSSWLEPVREAGRGRVMHSTASEPVIVFVELELGAGRQAVMEGSVRRR